MNFLDLFSGIGGFRLGAEWAGLKFEHEFNSDIEDYPNKVYKYRFPDSIQLGDIRKIDGHELKKQYGNDWIITGGFPCQDISVAGKGAGITGARSGLWFEMQRLIGELRPKYVIAENVGALTIRGLDRVLVSLAEIGYDAVWTRISARDIGAPHKRERIWIVAYPSKQQSPLMHTEFSEQEQRKFRRMGGEDELSNTDEIRQEREHESKEGQQPGGRRQARGESPTFNKITELPNANKVRCETNIQGFGGTEGSRHDQKIRCENRLESALVQTSDGHKSRWQRTFEPEFVRVVDGIPNQLDRIGALGNSIVPQIAKILFELCEENFG